MKPINFKEATKVLQRPSTMTDAECASLHVWSDGKQCVSCWKPSVGERVRILFGGKVYLGVKGGGTQPPVFVTAESPFFRPPFFARVKDKISNMILCRIVCEKRSERRKTTRQKKALCRRYARFFPYRSLQSIFGFPFGCSCSSFERMVGFKRTWHG